MVKVKNGKCVRRLSLRSLRASRKRNVIAVAAIILTTLLFASLFTVALSINRSYETYQFRQIGGYSHGSFKDVTEEQTDTTVVPSPSTSFLLSSVTCTFATQSGYSAA